MLELVLSSFAGLATAVAIKKFPRGPPRATEAEPHIIPKIAELEIERDVLTKTIARLYRHEDGLTRVQYNRLLAKYQHQLGETAGRIEWLRSTGAEPSLHGGLADLDQKLSAYRGEARRDVVKDLCCGDAEGSGACWCSKAG